MPVTVEDVLAKHRWPPPCEDEQQVKLLPADLGAAELFEEVIRRDKSFGPLLAQIKAGYDGFLQDRGISVPQTPVAVLQEKGTKAPQRRVRAVEDEGPRANLPATETVLDAARRAALGPEDVTPRGAQDDFFRLYELERENAALRRLVKRLRGDAAAGKLECQQAPPPPLGLAHYIDALQDSSAVAASARSAASGCSAGDWGAGPPGARKPVDSCRKPSWVPGLDLADMMRYADIEEDEEDYEDDGGGEEHAEHSAGSAGYASNGSAEDNSLHTPGTRAWISS